MEKLSDAKLRVYKTNATLIDVIENKNSRTFVHVSDLVADLLATRQKLEQAEAEGITRDNACKAFEQLYNELLEQYRWIAVSERLPETNNKAYDFEPATGKIQVIRKIDYNEKPDTKYDYGYMFSDHSWRNEAGNKIYVTHWMPLPLPPKERQG